MRLFGFLDPTTVPLMARPNYVHELRHMALWGVFAGLIDGSFSSIVVAKTFDASPLLISVVWATPNLAHLLSLFWGVFLRGRPRIAMFTVLALAAAVCTASIGLTPNQWEPWGGWIFALQVALSRIFLSGLVNLRSAIWNANYPQQSRGRIASGIQTLSGALFLAITLSASLLFDVHPDFYRWVYPAAALLGVLSLIPLWRVHVRHERAELNRFSHRRAVAHQDLGAVESRVLRRDWLDVVTILRTDREFARYCTAQYFLGSANFMVDPVLTIILTQSLKLSYFEASLLMDQLPCLIMIVTTRAWAKLFDRVGVLRFRVLNSAMWLSSTVLVAIGVLLLSLGSGAERAALGVILVGRILNGVGRGGGTIAWNLGHLHFAGRHNADLYMGIHVGLTGLRGLIMPFVANLIYALAGGFAFVVAAGSALTSLVLFKRLAAGQPGDAGSARAGVQPISTGSVEALDGTGVGD